MRKKMVAGNWKMNGVRADVVTLLETIKEGARLCSEVSIVIFPSFVHLHLAEKCLVDSIIGWGGQDLYLGHHGAFTGEISAPMLVEYGCQYVLVGHSERRHLFHEDAILVTEKFKAAIRCGLQPVLCLGETLQERKQGQTEAVIAEQLESVIKVVGIEVFRLAVIAYEPVWAIGTGLTAQPEEAQSVHQFIRRLLAGYDVDVADATHILYGGSVTAENAPGLFAMPDIDGGLVGGASLKANSFLAICQTAAKNQ